MLVFLFNSSLCKFHLVPTEYATTIKSRILVNASSQAPAWEFSEGSSSFLSHEATCMDRYLLLQICPCRSGSKAGAYFLT